MRNRIIKTIIDLFNSGQTKKDFIELRKYIEYNIEKLPPAENRKAGNILERVISIINDLED